MGERGEFVPRRREGRNLASLWAVAAALAAHAAVVPPSPLESRLIAREIAPGEPVRVEVRSQAPLASLTGRFLGEVVFFVRSAQGDLWEGWTVVPLDCKDARATLTLEGRDPSNRPVRSSVETAIVPKSFPEQRLEVESKYVNPSKAALARIAREQERLGAIYLRRTPAPLATERFVAPVAGEPTSEFGARRILNGEPRAPHPGIDLRAATGTPVAAAGPGRVALAADLYYSGGTVIVDHGGGLFTTYAHLSKVEVEEGATVAPGDRLGLSGATGRVTGPHLHWGARVGRSIFDPRALLDPRLFPLMPPSATAAGGPEGG
ncbi:MAG TPA: M23 family metallopeptidase [Candidatus Polarisedimenticolaceae bacterium]|nr:M23 family metallopeptidase [Candidatus Polarisedimenticolaceae bacterium]